MLIAINQETLFEYMELLPFFSGCVSPKNRNDISPKTIKLICLGPKKSGKTLFVYRLLGDIESIDEENYSITNHYKIQPKNQYVTLDITDTVGDLSFISLYKNALKKYADIALIFFPYSGNDLEQLDTFIGLADSVSTQQKIVVINKKEPTQDPSFIEMYCLKNNTLNVSLDVNSLNDLEVLLDLIVSLMHTNVECEILEEMRPRSRSREECLHVLI